MVSILFFPYSGIFNNIIIYYSFWGYLMESNHILFTLLSLIPFLIYIGFFVFVIYAIISSLHLMRQRNEYLKEIRNELKKSNGFN